MAGIKIPDTISGVKTFNDGISFGNETMLVYDEGTITIDASDITAVTNCTVAGSGAVGTIYYTKVGKLIAGTISINLVSSSGNWTLEFNKSVLTSVVGALREYANASTISRLGNETGYTGLVYTTASTIKLEFKNAHVGTGDFTTSFCWINS